MTARPRRAPFFAALLRKLPTGMTPLEAVCVVKGLDAEGNVCLFVHKTKDLAVWEAYGMLAYAMDDYTPSTMAANGAADD